MDCRISCQRCCKWGHAVLSEQDIQNISGYLRIPEDTFIQQYTDITLKQTYGVTALLSEVNKRGCVFLEESGCSIYSVRPEKCRNFPRADQIDASLAEVCVVARKLSRKG